MLLDWFGTWPEAIPTWQDLDITIPAMKRVGAGESRSHNKVVVFLRETEAEGRSLETGVRPVCPHITVPTLLRTPRVKPLFAAKAELTSKQDTMREQI